MSITRVMVFILDMYILDMLVEQQKEMMAIMICLILRVRILFIFILIIIMVLIMVWMKGLLIAPQLIICI